MAEIIRRGWSVEMAGETDKHLERATDALERLNNKMSDLQRYVEMLFHMTEKHQQQVRDLLTQIAKRR